MNSLKIQATKKYQKLIISIFLTYKLHLNLFSQTTEETTLTLYNFKHPQYGKHSSEIPELMIYGDKAKSEGIFVYLEGLKLDWFEDSLDKIKATVTTPSGIFDKSNKTIKGDEKVTFNSDFMTVDGVGFYADSEKKIIRIFSKVKVILKKDLDIEEKTKQKNSSEKNKNEKD